MPTLTGQPSKDISIISMLPGPVVTVVALEPSDGPVPPPIKVVVPFDKAASACCGEMKWICVSIPAAVRIKCEPEIASVARPSSKPDVTPSMVCGLPDLPMAQMSPSLMPTSALTTPCTASIIVTLVMTRSGAPALRVNRLSMPMPSRKLLPPPNTISSPSRPRRSRSISTNSPVSPNRMRSPTVGPNKLTYSLREIVAMGCPQFTHAVSSSSRLRASRAESTLTCQFYSLGLPSGGILTRRRTINEVIESENGPLSPKRHQSYLPLVARLEPHGSRRRNVEVKPKCRSAVELKGTIDFEKMKVRTDLHRAIARIAHGKLRHLFFLIEVTGS